MLCLDYLPVDSAEYIYHAVREMVEADEERERAAQFVGPIGPCDRTGTLTDLQCFEAFSIDFGAHQESSLWSIRRRKQAGVSAYNRPERNEVRQARLDALAAFYANNEAAEVSPFDDTLATENEACDWN